MYQAHKITEIFSSFIESIKVEDLLSRIFKRVVDVAVSENGFRSDNSTHAGGSATVTVLLSKILMFFIANFSKRLVSLNVRYENVLHQSLNIRKGLKFTSQKRKLLL